MRRYNQRFALVPPSRACYARAASRGVALASLRSLRLRLVFALARWDLNRRAKSRSYAPARLRALHWLRQCHEERNNHRADISALIIGKKAHKTYESKKPAPIGGIDRHISAFSNNRTPRGLSLRGGDEGEKGAPIFACVSFARRSKTPAKQGERMKAIQQKKRRAQYPQRECHLQRDP